MVKLVFAPRGMRLETASRSRRFGSASPALTFFTWLRSLACRLTRAKTPASADASESKPAWHPPLETAKISLYRLIGLNAWAARRLDVHLSLRAYRRTFGRNPNLVQPSLFSEKVTARKLFDRRPVFSLLADKLLAREFAAARIGTEHLPRLHMICDRFEEIDFDRLPDRFVIKANHGTHWNLFVEDKAALDKAAARRLVNRWLKYELLRELARILLQGRQTQDHDRGVSGGRLPARLCSIFASMSSTAW